MNYIIVLSDGCVFGGWNPIDGKMIILPPNRRNLAYRMQHTVADRTVGKVREFANMDCFIERISA